MAKQGGDTLPEVKRSVEVQASNAIPDFGAEYRNAAAATNSLSAIGAEVAQAASTQMATQRGLEAGQNPRGDLFPAITGYDKTFAKAYEAQSQATLTLQGNKLMMDADVEMSKASKITPGLIKQTQDQVNQGLAKIAENAPMGVKQNLQNNFAGQMMSTTHQYQMKMVGEQKEEQKNILISSLTQNTQTAYEMARDGNFKGAMDLANQSKGMAESGVNSRYMTPTQARVAHDSISQAAINGKYVHDLMIARENGVEAEFEHQFSKSKPAGITWEQYEAAGQSMLQHKNQMDALQSQEQQLKMSQFSVALAKDPGGVTANMLEEVKSDLSPIHAQQVELQYIQAMKAFKNTQEDTQNLLSNWGNSTLLANAPDKAINAAFNQGVDNLIKKKGLTREDAEVQTAAAAGAKVPVFIDTLNNQLTSGNPAEMESASRKIHELQQMQAGHALIGLSDVAKVSNEKYASLLGSMAPDDAAREATNLVANQTIQMQKDNKEKYANHLATMTKNGVSNTDFILATVDKTKKEFLNTTTAEMYASDILSQYSTYYQLSNGDANVAKKVTKKFVEDNFGDTWINGGKNTTLHPLEKTLGYSTPDVVPYIHQDMADQFNERAQETKNSYITRIDDKGKVITDEKILNDKSIPARFMTNEYWEVKPVDKKDRAYFGSDYPPLQMVKHSRQADGEKTETFNVVLQGNAFNTWDVAIDTEYGMRNLFQEAPYLGIVTYVPRKKNIDDNFMKDHKLK